MRITSILIILLYLTLNSYCQNIQILERFEIFNPITKPTEFQYLNDKLDASKSMKIATIKGTFKYSRKSGLVDLFISLKNFSNNNGANSFRVEKKYINIDSSFVILTVYFTSLSYLEENFNLHPKNKVFIIGSLNLKRKYLQKVKINKKPVFIGPLEYFEYQNSDGATLKINIGGISGTTIKMLGEENRNSIFLSFIGVSVTPSSIYPISVGINAGYPIGIGINTGRFYKVDENIGYFLKEILLPSAN